MVGPVVASRSRPAVARPSGGVSARSAAAHVGRYKGARIRYYSLMAPAPDLGVFANGLTVEAA